MAISISDSTVTRGGEAAAALPCAHRHSGLLSRRGRSMNERRVAARRGVIPFADTRETDRYAKVNSGGGSCRRGRRAAVNFQSRFATMPGAGIRIPSRGIVANEVISRVRTGCCIIRGAQWMLRRARRDCAHRIKFARVEICVWQLLSSRRDSRDRTMLVRTLVS